MPSHGDTFVLTKTTSSSTAGSIARLYAGSNDTTRKPAKGAFALQLQLWRGRTRSPALLYKLSSLASTSITSLTLTTHCRELP